MTAIQRHLFSTDPTLTERLISWLLWHANTDPPVWKARFYLMKDEILRRHGRQATDPQFEWQEITHHCWSCEGTGGLYEPGGCYKCGGSGVYRRIWVPLYRWRIGGRVFHKPGEATTNPPYRYPSQPDHPFIRGRIHHEPSPHAWKAALLLAMVFDRRYAWALLSEARPLRWWFGFRRWMATQRHWWTARCETCGRRLALSRYGDWYYCSAECARAPFDGIPF